jgi:hypothetical protein
VENLQLFLLGGLFMASAISILLRRARARAPAKDPGTS